jgi:hypothetical protein
MHPGILKLRLSIHACGVAQHVRYDVNAFSGSIEADERL